MKKELTRSKKKTRKIIKTVIFWVLIAGFLGWFASLRINLENNPNQYDYVIPFENRPLNEYKSASGVVVMNDIETVSTEVSQKIKKVYFKIGDHVKEGDILCEFESDTLDEQIERIEKYINDSKSMESLKNGSESGQAEYQRNMAAINVEQASLAVQAARKAYDDTYAKYIEYFELCYSTSNPDEADMYLNMYTEYLNQLEPINDQIRAAQKQYNEALEASNKLNEMQSDNEYIKSLTTSNISEYEKQLEKLRNEKDNLIVTAPKSGIIADCYAVEGGYALDGGLFRIGTLGKYKVEAYVSARDVLDVYPGMEASFKTTLSGADEIKARLVKVSDIYTNSYFGSSGYAVELEIEDPAYMEMLRHNVSASVKIYTVNKGTVPAVQYDAVAEDEDGTSYVYKAVKKNGNYVASKVNVEKGYEASFYVEILSDELAEGDLIVGNASEHSEGDLLKIRGEAD